MKVYFIEGEIQAATNYILANNPAAKLLGWTYADVFNRINQLYLSCCDQVLKTPTQAPYAATMGVTVIGDECGDDCILLRALVVPAFGEYELSRMA